MLGRLTTYQHCEWKSEGQQCRFPGTVSHVIHASPGPHPGPWFCALHCRCSDQVQGRDIVLASQSYLPPAWAPGERCPLVEAIAAQFKRFDDLPRSVRELNTNECRAKVREVGKGSKSVAWAHRILERVAAGETVPQISVQYAEAALGRVSHRNPGEDDEPVTEAA